MKFNFSGQQRCMHKAIFKVPADGKRLHLNFTSLPNFLSGFSPFSTNFNDLLSSFRNYYFLFSKHMSPFQLDQNIREVCRKKQSLFLFLNVNHKKLVTRTIFSWTLSKVSERSKEKSQKSSAINVNFNHKVITKLRDVTSLVNQSGQQNCFISRRTKKYTIRRETKIRSV